MTNGDPAASDLSKSTLQLLRDNHAYIQGLPEEDRSIASLAAEGTPVWEIARRLQMSDAAVASSISRVVAALSGREIEPVETGGLGADTDPGVSGGYDPEPFGER